MNGKFKIEPDVFIPNLNEGSNFNTTKSKLPRPGIAERNCAPEILMDTSTIPATNKENNFSLDNHLQT